MEITPAAAGGQVSPAAAGGQVSKARRSRQVASWASLACVAVLLTACNSSTSSVASSTSSAAPRPGHRPDRAAGTPSTSAPITGPTTPPSTPASSPSLAAAPTGAGTFLAAEQSLNGTLLHEPACGGFGCALSGDSTAFLFHMTWTTWSGSEAVGTGTYKLDDCNPDCAGGHVYSVATVVTLSQPVKVCSSSGTRWVWTHALVHVPRRPAQGPAGPERPAEPLDLLPPDHRRPANLRELATSLPTPAVPPPIGADAAMKHWVVIAAPMEHWCRSR